ncbi:hypothetical protein [Rhodococcus koreensis]|uniref:hypothetical protein n=1 Tax=Rhodococcus koreensis TaxID=99653 RepID=UPI00366BC3A4
MSFSPVSSHESTGAAVGGESVFIIFLGVEEALATTEVFKSVANPLVGAAAGLPSGLAHRAAVLLSADDYDVLRETIAVLSDTDLLTAHLAGRAELEGGDVVDAQELARLMRDARSSGE